MLNLSKFVFGNDLVDTCGFLGDIADRQDMSIFLGNHLDFDSGNKFLIIPTKYNARI